MERVVEGKTSQILELRQSLECLEEELQNKTGFIKELQELLKEKESSYEKITSTTQRVKDNLSKELSTKENELMELRSELKASILAEQKRHTNLEAINISQSEEISRLESELLQTKERLLRIRKQYEEQLEQERALGREQVANAIRDGEAHASQLQGELASLRSSLRMRISELERSLEEQEHVRTDLTAMLSRERTRREEEVALAVQESKTREACRFTQLEERLNNLRDERVQVEKQLAQAQSQILQLQQQNTALIGEMAEPQRKLSQLHEELSTERLVTQRLRQELADETSRLQTKTRDNEHLQSEVEKLQQQMTQLNKAHQEAIYVRVTECERLQSLMTQREREIDNIRTQEMERANVLYSAFNKYLSSMTPHTPRLHMSHST